MCFGDVINGRIFDRDDCFILFLCFFFPLALPRQASSWLTQTTKLQPFRPHLLLRMHTGVQSLKPHPHPALPCTYNTHILFQFVLLWKSPNIGKNTMHVTIFSMCIFSTGQPYSKQRQGCIQKMDLGGSRGGTHQIFKI